jgi:hypothetical protein
MAISSAPTKSVVDMPPAMKMQHLNATSPTPLSPPDVATAPIADTPDDAIDTPAIAPSPSIPSSAGADGDPLLMNLAARHWYCASTTPQCMTLTMRSNEDAAYYATSPTPLSPPDVAAAPIADAPDDAIDSPAIAPSPNVPSPTGADSDPLLMNLATRHWRCASTTPQCMTLTVRSNEDAASYATSPTLLSPPDVAAAPITDAPDDAIDTPTIAPSPSVPSSIGAYDDPLLMSLATHHWFCAPTTPQCMTLIMQCWDDTTSLYCW